jgi:hypothetical protein
MTGVGLVMRDQQGRQLSDNHLVDLWWFKFSLEIPQSVGKVIEGWVPLIFFGGPGFDSGTLART